ncbi:Arabinanase/levansucrase/invertase [Neocallimastix lanati (nom. inval.)]|nr:Arabinanase/levansucrase/invertase [Neocallimastix sp. JGI-2020a]
MKSVFFSTILAIAGALVSANDAFKNVVPKETKKPIPDHNPINVIKYTADPGVMVYDDTVYVYGTNDGITEIMDENPESNDYALIHTINVMSSKDLVNWVDHGTIPSAGKDGAAKWAQNSWAPTAAHKKINGKEKFFLYFANSGNGIGVLTSDSPTGPFEDPIGDYLISHDTPNCADITWLFDPAVFVDDDGSAYIYFGGGVPGEYDNHPLYKDAPLFERPRTLRVAKLGDDMISLATEPVLLDAPWPYEDSGIHKADGIYYYTYCTSWNEKSPFGAARIGMMASKNPLGPFEFVDTIFNNPGDFFVVTGNNHHTVIPFHDKWYIFYHSEWLNLQNYGEAKGYRTTHVNELPYVDGKFLNATGTLEGVPQLFNVDAFETQTAALMAWEAGCSTNGLGHTTVTYQKGEWSGVSGVDFAEGADAIEIVAQSKNGAVIQVSIDSVEGEVLGYVEIPASDKMETVFAEIAPVKGVKNVFFLASDEVTVDTWEFGHTDDCSEEEESADADADDAEDVESNDEENVDVDSADEAEVEEEDSADEE